MQKIDFVRSLGIIVEKLKSKEIIRIFEEGFSHPNVHHQFNNITPLLFLSKSNYDQLKVDKNYTDILESMEANSIYIENNLSTLSSILQHQQGTGIVLNAIAIKLYNFHSTLVSALNLSRKTLLNNSDDFANSIENGVIIFQVVIEGAGLETEKYIKIFEALETLIETISKIVSDKEKKSEIVLLDSGSDTNIGVKTAAETANSLFLIFKEIWDFITNFRFYKNKQKNEALLESLSIRAEITKKIQEGVITEEEGKKYMHLIKTRTDQLIGMKVLPKQIVVDRTTIDNKKLLEEFENVKLLVIPPDQADENYA